MDKCQIFTVLFANAVVLCWLEPRSEEDPSTSLGLLAVGNVTLHSSCTCHEQGFHITKWNIIKIALMCSLVFVFFFQSSIKVLNLFFFSLLSSLLSLLSYFFLNIFCCCRNRPRCLTSSLEGAQDLSILQKSNQIKVVSPQSGVHNFPQHLFL